MPRIAPNIKEISKALRTRGVYSIAKHPGLYLSATGDVDGNASWRIKYRPRGAKNQRWHTITNDVRGADFSTVAEEARKLLLTLKMEGIDPKITKHSGQSFDALFEAWLERHAKLKKKSWTHDEQMYHRHIKSRLGSKTATEVSKRDIIAALNDIASKATGIQANRAQSLISSIFTWAVAEELIENHPAVRIPKRASEQARERVWTPDELKRLWIALRDITSGDTKGPITPQIARAIQLLALTGKRRSEVAHAVKSEFEGAIWKIPAARMKGREAHTVPLASMAASVVAEAIAKSGDSEFVFPGHSGGRLDPLSIGKALNRLIASLNIKGVTLHDLRRTMATEMGRLKVLGDTIGRVLAHAKTGVTDKHYVLHSYDPQKLAAYEVWEAELRRITSE